MGSQTRRFALGLPPLLAALELLFMRVISARYRVLYILFLCTLALLVTSQFVECREHASPGQMLFYSIVFPVGLAWYFELLPKQLLSESTFIWFGYWAYCVTLLLIMLSNKAVYQRSGMTILAVLLAANTFSCSQTGVGILCGE